MFQPHMFKIMEIELSTGSINEAKNVKRYRFYHEKEELAKQIDILINKNNITYNGISFSLTPEGREILKHKLKKHSRKYDSRNK